MALAGQSKGVDLWEEGDWRKKNSCFPLSPVSSYASLILVFSIVGGL
jgi:hypothetical protein